MPEFEYTVVVTAPDGDAADEVMSEYMDTLEESPVDFEYEIRWNRDLPL